jgi:uncharacterized protein (DUF488 family)
LPADAAPLDSHDTAFYTIGHSTRSISEFVSLLQSAGVTCVADVRTVPRSRKNPQYNSDTFSRSLAEFEMGYEHIASLGGLRGRSCEVPPEVNAFWENQSFHNYADYAMGEAFRGGLTRLGELARTRCCAIMCAEAVWWRCHRRIITDYLIAEGKKVFHILRPGQIDVAWMTSAAQRGPSGALIYPSGPRSPGRPEI